MREKNVRVQYLFSCGGRFLAIICSLRLVSDTNIADVIIFF